MGILATVESFCNNPCNVKKYFATIINPIVKGRLLFKFVTLLFKVFLNLSLRDSRAAAERRSKGRNGVDGFDRVTSATLRNRLQRSAATSHSSIPQCWTRTVFVLLWFLFLYCKGN